MPAAMRPSPLRTLRQQRSLAQHTVATAIGTDQTVISLLERGSRLSGEVFRRLAAYYAVSPALLARRMAAWSRAYPDRVPRRASYPETRTRMGGTMPA
jgi:transcriptional regulator with XRE-family HTH domain